mgnify:CR=1 FL=1
MSSTQLLKVLERDHGKRCMCEDVMSHGSNNLNHQAKREQERGKGTYKRWKMEVIFYVWSRLPTTLLISLTSKQMLFKKGNDMIV